MESINTNNLETNTSTNKKSKILIEEIPLGLTFDDVLMMPQYSDIN